MASVELEDSKTSLNKVVWVEAKVALETTFLMNLKSSSQEEVVLARREAHHKPQDLEKGTISFLQLKLILWKLSMV